MRAVRLQRHYDMYMPGEAAAFPDQEAANIVKRRLGVYVDEPEAEDVAAPDPAAESAPEALSEAPVADAKDLTVYPDRMQRRVRTK